jgi:hypothetical protein
MSAYLKRTGMISRKKPLPAKGRKSRAWQEFRDQKAKRDCDEEGLIKCQDWKIGLPRCGIAIPNPDLHHVVGRETDPRLYFEESNLIWLHRGCHNEAHS